MRGISPVVAIVLMIAVAVVGSTAVYFFSSGLATKESGTDSSDISTTAMSATVTDSQNGIVLIQNLGTSDISAQTLNVAGVDTAGCVISSTIAAGDQGVCRMTGFEGEATIYGSGLGSAVVKAGVGDTNPYFVAFMKPTGAYQAGVEAVANAAYAYLINQGYNVTNVTRLTTDFSDFDLIVVGPDAAYYVGGCFPAGTQISTGLDTTVSIESLVVGQQVLSPEGGLVEVLATYELEREGYYSITAGSFSVDATAEHPFLTTSGYKEASELRVGDTLITIDGVQEITSIEYVDSPTTVYNLGVSGSHEFYANGFAVHNKPS